MAKTNRQDAGNSVNRKDGLEQIRFQKNYFENKRRFLQPQ
jgi:hypothetical protein